MDRFASLSIIAIRLLFLCLATNDFSSPLLAPSAALCSLVSASLPGLPPRVAATNVMPNCGYRLAVAVAVETVA